MSGYRKEVGLGGQDGYLKSRAVLWVVLSPDPLQSLVQMYWDGKGMRKGGPGATGAEVFIVLSLTLASH